MNTAINNNLPVLSNEGGLSAYLDQIKKFPMLDAEEEYMLAKNWKTTGNIKSAEKLVTSHLRLVAKIAMGYKGYGLPVNEMISEGNIGLMQAVKKFEPEKGFRLATYAMWWIKASIQEYILRSWSLVKIGTTTAQKKLFFNLKKIKNQIAPQSEGDLKDDHVNEIANKLDVSKDEVVSMNRRLSGKEFSLNAQVGEDGEETVRHCPICKAEGHDVEIQSCRYIKPEAFAPLIIPHRNDGESGRGSNMKLNHARGYMKAEDQTRQTGLSRRHRSRPRLPTPMLGSSDDPGEDYFSKFWGGEGTNWKHLEAWKVQNDQKWAKMSKMTPEIRKIGKKNSGNSSSVRQTTRARI